MARIYIDTCHVADAYTFYTHIHIYIYIYIYIKKTTKKTSTLRPSLAPKIWQETEAAARARRVREQQQKMSLAVEMR